MSLSWIVFYSLIIFLLFLDLGVFHKENKIISVKESIYSTIFYIIIAFLFGLGIWYFRGSVSATEYFTGYIVEKTLSMDNVFVIAVIFSYLNIPREMQHRVLFWGICSVIVLRGIMIYIGAELIREFSWILYLFGAFLVLTGVKLLFHKQDFDPSKSRLMIFLRKHFNIIEDVKEEHFFVYKNGKLYMTKLFVALIMIEFMDLIFAIDSIPAIFAITTDLYIVYTSNIFALLGLRALYFALDHMANHFYYIRHALAVILVMVGIKVFLSHTAYKIPVIYTLTLTIIFLIAGVVASIYKIRNEQKTI